MGSSWKIIWVRKDVILAYGSRWTRNYAWLGVRIPSVTHSDPIYAVQGPVQSMLPGLLDIVALVAFWLWCRRTPTVHDNGKLRWINVFDDHNFPWQRGLDKASASWSIHYNSDALDAAKCDALSGIRRIFRMCSKTSACSVLARIAKSSRTEVVGFSVRI